MAENILPKIELLAPAGNWDALRAACANGANAVYFGLDRFNARHRATNFSLEELPSVMAFLHQRNVLGFVTLNTLIFSDELEDVLEYAQQLHENHVDAVIVQDVGLAWLLAVTFPNLHVHASTQMTLSERRGVQFVHQHLGIRRVVLARELSISEISKISQDAPEVPTEVFIHGALCVAYSGQCLTSEALGGRSANRGQCAQACRLPYDMLVDGEVRDLGDRAYLLSPQDLAGYDQVAELIQAGVISFKIEGRLKSAEYVAATTSTYRSAIDHACRDEKFQLSPAAKHDLDLTFSRGFTPGFLHGPKHQELVAGQFPKSRGAFVGTTIRKSQRGIVVQLKNDENSFLKPGAGIVFDLGKPQEKEPGGYIQNIRKLGENTVEITIESPHFDPKTVPLGAKVWQTADPEVRNRLLSTFQQDIPYYRLPLDFHLHGRLAGELTLTATTPDATASCMWVGPLEPARNQPTTQEMIVQQLSRLGDTPYQLGACTTDLPEQVMVPKSVLNQLRREVIDKIQKSSQTIANKEVTKPDSLLKEKRSEIFQNLGNKIPSESSYLCVHVRTLEQLQAVVDHQPATVYCDFEDVRQYREAVSIARGAKVPIGLATLRIIKPGEEGLLKTIAQLEPDYVLIRNLAGLSYYREHTPHLALVGDFSLNIANEMTAAFFMQHGLTRIVPSYDMNWEQFAAMAKRCPPEWLEPVIHQHMPMFHMEHCVFAAFLSTGNDWRDCGRPCDSHRLDLQDRTGALFPVTPDTGCRNTVHNAVAQSAAEYVSRMQGLGIIRFRIDLLRENAAQSVELVRTYQKVLSGGDGRTVWKQLQAMNQLGVTRGTLNLL
ncbi:MAG: DUF3656 domain-containing protein [Zavarzinella sp.]